MIGASIHVTKLVSIDFNIKGGTNSILFLGASHFIIENLSMGFKGKGHGCWHDFVFNVFLPF